MVAGTPKAQATAARISGVAAELFLANGYESTTVADVAGASGVAVGTVLLHFGSKSELATAAFSHSIVDAVVRAGQTMPEGTAAEQVSHIVGRLFRWYRKHEGVAPLLLRESLFSSGPPALRYNEAVLHTVSIFQGICVSHQAEGNLSARLDPALVAEGILADYLLVLLQGLRGRFGSGKEQLAHFNALLATRIP